MSLDIIGAILNKEGIKYSHLSAVQGGDISEAYQVQALDSAYFIKVNSTEVAEDMFDAEADGLSLIQKSGQIAVPKVIKCGLHNSRAYLILEFIQTGTKSNHAMAKFGRQLANMHLQTQYSFGLDTQNFIGKLPQSNAKHLNWISFYIGERLEPQFKLALDNGLLQAHDIPPSANIDSVLDSLMPEIKPSLLHGDLWGGNFLIDAQGDAYLIDPAVYYGHSEVDIAMSRLFGGFSPSFYNAYFEIHPKEIHFEARRDIYQLYYLLVHLNLFGSSYYGSVKRIMERYF
ncbi:MAG: phosphotransferase [Saprospiraceae bacterium]|nr:phosphotransferase [Saprospiraceae bacterium]